MLSCNNICCFLEYKESTKTINDVLEKNNKELWRQSNKTLAIEIAEVTESFGKELADKWSNETSAVISSETNIGEHNLCFIDLFKPWNTLVLSTWFYIKLNAALLFSSSVCLIIVLIL